MLGAFIGFILGLFFVACIPEVSNWWMLGGAIIGFFIEVMARLGAGEGVGDAFCACVDLSSYSIGDSGGSYSSDCGGSGDSGGGGDGGGD